MADGTDKMAICAAVNKRLNGTMKGNTTTANDEEEASSSEKVNVSELAWI